MARLRSEIEARSIDFSGFVARTGIKPVKWIGTQRSVYTHRKKQKRIKELLGKVKENKQRNADKKAETKVESKH